MNPQLVPVIPETAPFTPEQRAWLNGFFAGLFSVGEASAPPAAPPLPVTILFGSQTGTAEAVAKQTAKACKKNGWEPKVVDLLDYSPGQLQAEKRVLIITSTHGEGEMPDNARAFWADLKTDAAPNLTNLEFSVLALGDSVYASFCQAGKELDARLEELGAKRFHPRVDCDKDYDKSFQTWLAGILRAKPGDTTEVAAEAVSNKTQWGGRLLQNARLNAEDASKDTRHVVISLENSGLAYEAGDALGVVPTNCPELVQDVIDALGCDGEEGVPDGTGRTLSLRRALLDAFDLRTPSRPFLEYLAGRGDENIKQLLAPEAKDHLAQYLYGREVIDLLLDSPVKLTAAEFTGLLRKLQHRLYSISSSPKAHPKEVHLTVAVVRYESHGRWRKGLCSTYLSDRVNESPVPVFVQANKNFRLPADGARPVIMIGPGTGIAPFRAFMQERRATGATGRNWIFFGDRNAKTDFLYRDELQAWRKDGSLHELELAFSRDQAEKIYVQNRMMERAGDLYAWLEGGAHVYVCGDASRMAKDVDAALHTVVEKAGGRSPEQAATYVRALQKEKRYLRDVY